MPLDKESRYLLQKLDCNCNDCGFMVRNMDKFKSFDEFYKGRENAARINYGFCSKFNKEVSFIPNTMQIETA